MTRVLAIAFTLLTIAGCKGSTEPAGTTTSPAAPSEADTDQGWQRGTVTIGPDGNHAIHADDDSVTVCAPDLPAELQVEGLAVRFAGELIPPAPNERRWCTLAKDLKVERAE